MQPFRSGSAILLCLGLASIAVMVGFAFLRTVSRQDMSGTSAIIEGLARDAARSGLAHATEQIMADYNSTSLKVGVGAAGNATISPVPTHLDGPYRAPFSSIYMPGKLLYTQSNATNGTDDAQQENHLLMPFIRKDSDGAGARVAEAWYCDRGLMIYDGRGRFYEPGYYNIARDTTSTPARPVTPVLFTDAAATASGRSAPLFLDRKLHRLAGITATDRTAARYRVRYAIGVEDLQGHLLANPRADVDIDWRKTTWGDDHYRANPNWLNTYAHVWDSMNGAFFTITYGFDAGGILKHWMPTVPLRLDHVFRGRGNASNADRAWAPGSTNGQPAAFPWMFRAIGSANTPNQWWGNHTWNGNASMPSLYDGVYDGSSGNNENLGGRLYRYAANSVYPSIQPTPAGGQILTPLKDMSVHQPYVHALLGPQISWYNLLASIQGGSPPFGSLGESADGYGGAADYIMAGRSYYLTNHTVFGRRMESTPATNSSTKWYQGPVDNPWLVNALTATPQTIHMMILGYLPGHLKTVKYVQDEYYAKINEVPYTDSNGNPQVNEVYDSNIAIDPKTTLPKIQMGPWYTSIRGIEILNDQLGSGFADFPAPSSTEMVGAPFTAQTISIKPDYFQDNPDPRPIEQRYPGPLCRGDSAVANQGSDDLGHYIDTDSRCSGGDGTDKSLRAIGRCTHTGRPLLWLAAYDQWRIEDSNEYPKLPTWKNGFKYKVLRKLDSKMLQYADSYFWDLSLALTQSLSFARATWLQYPNHVFDPATGFSPASLRDPQKYDTVEKLDRLFLRQLGEDFDNPGSPCNDYPILVPIIGQADAWKDPSSYSYSLATTMPKYTIAKLRNDPADLLRTTSGVTSVERVKVMERMLNDFRLSFFGCSPAYRASFRPLDFDGDHKVQCSAYDINGDATADEKKYKTARWKADDGAGHGPALVDLTNPGTDYPTGFSSNPWFCATGAFFIGKSHYYRIFARGEVYDNLLQKPISSRTLESVLAVDPEATIDPHDVARPASNKPDTQVLFQRWHHNDQTSEFPRHVR